MGAVSAFHCSFARTSIRMIPISPPLVCVMIAGRETQNNGIMKMLALPVDRQTLSLAKFCVLVFYLFMEMVVFFVVFIVAGWLVTPV